MFQTEEEEPETISTTSSTSPPAVDDDLLVAPITSASPRGDALDGMQCRLEGSELWAKFYDLGTEMIITKSGRSVVDLIDDGVYEDGS